MAGNFLVRILLSVINSFLSHGKEADKPAPRVSRLSKRTSRLGQPGKHRLEVTQSEIWYTHTAHLSSGISSPEKGAQSLIESGLAELAWLPSGKIAWRTADNKVTFGAMFEKSHGWDENSAQIRFPEDLPPHFRSLVVQVAAMRSAERNLFKTTSLPDDAIRIFLPGFKLVLSLGNPVDLDVYAKLYFNGLIVLSFIVEDKRSFGINEFIDDRVNLGFSPIAGLELHPRVARALVTAGVSKNAEGYSGRKQALKTIRTFDQNYPVQTRVNGSVYIRLSADPGQTVTLKKHGLELIDSIAYCLIPRRSGIAYLAFGDDRPPFITGSWRASPHIHLISFSDQRWSMKENEHYFKSDLAMILSRTTDDSLQVKLPRNLRLRDDQGFYISEACILHVYCPLREPYSATGTEDQPFRFPTLHNQVKGELVEVGPFVYLSLLHELENSNLSWDRVHSMWETCADFELHLQQSGRSGEVRKSIQEGLRTRDFDSLKQLAHDALTRRERGAFLAESRRTNSQTGCAAFILSLLSIPPLVAWSKDKLKIFKFPDENPWLLDVAGFVIAIAILAGALWCAMFLFKIFNSFWLKRWNKKNRVR